MGSALHNHWSCVSDMGWSPAFGGLVIGRTSDGGVSQSDPPRLAEPQAPGRLSLRRAASLAPGSAGGPRGPGFLRPQTEDKEGRC